MEDYRLSGVETGIPVQPGAWLLSNLTLLY